MCSYSHDFVNKLVGGLEKEGEGGNGGKKGRVDLLREQGEWEMGRGFGDDLLIFALIE